MFSDHSSSLLAPVDLSDLAVGNVGIPYAHRLDSGQPGPAVLVTALVHGNELCGAHALRRFFDLGIRPVRGSLVCCFCNIEAYDSFDPALPARARFVDEDFNRVWDLDVLEGARRSAELERAREVRPLVDEADYLLDLHSMQTECEPLMLSGVHRRGTDLARRMGYPHYIVSDAGHAAGLRMRDYGGFGDVGEGPTALLAECGQHLDPAAARAACEVLARFLLTLGVVAREDALRLSDLPERPAPKLIEVTGRVTVRHTGFRFQGDAESLQVIPKAGTIIAVDGGEPVRTPHDDCILIMPSRRLAPGQTAVRLGRFVDRA